MPLLLAVADSVSIAQFKRMSSTAMGDPSCMGLEMAGKYGVFQYFAETFGVEKECMEYGFPIKPLGVSGIENADIENGSQECGQVLKRQVAFANRSVMFQKFKDPFVIASG